MFAWICVVASMTLLILYRTGRAVRKYVGGHRPILELGTEREEIWVPGDPLEEDEMESEDD